MRTIGRTILMVTAFGLVACGPSPEELRERADRSEAEAERILADQGIAVDPPHAASPWSYRTERDELTGREVSYACTVSNNTIRLGFPYESQQLSLCLRRHPRYGRDVIIRLPSGGQFVCPIRGCVVQVRMGDGDPSAYTVYEADDGSPDVLFIANDTRFLRGLRNVSEVAIAVDYYRNGNQTALFSTANLEWEAQDSPPARQPSSTVTQAEPTAPSPPPSTVAPSDAQDNKKPS